MRMGMRTIARRDAKHGIRNLVFLELPKGKTITKPGRFQVTLSPQIQTKTENTIASVNIGGLTTHLQHDMIFKIGGTDDCDIKIDHKYPFPVLATLEPIEQNGELMLKIAPGSEGALVNIIGGGYRLASPRAYSRRAHDFTASLGRRLGNIIESVEINVELGKGLPWAGETRLNEVAESLRPQMLNGGVSHL